MTRTDDSPVPDYQARLRLDGRSFVVIGAGQGIGRQVTHALTGAGARTVCVDREPDQTVTAAGRDDLRVRRLKPIAVDLPNLAER